MAVKRSIASETEVLGDINKKRRRRTKDSACPAPIEANNNDVKLSCTFATASEKTEASPEKTEAPVSTTAMQVAVRVAILVPFRDNHPTQHRQAHLDEFVPYMTKFLHRHCAAKRLSSSSFHYAMELTLSNDILVFCCSASFHIFILEQSLDGRKFNRGKLLNAGFDMSCNDYDVYIFHDVDLLPEDDLSEFYTSVPHVGPMHIARVWERYSDSSNYFGGIVAFTRQQFLKVNGFPNNFWGWGGEDNELYCRVVRKNLIVQTPTSGTVRDLEAMSLEEKLTVLRKSKWKCTVKRELLKEHHRTWKKNGLKSLQYEYVDAEAINEHCTKITVKLGPNGHWSDSRSSLEHPTGPDQDLVSCMVLSIPTASKTSSDIAASSKPNAKDTSNAVDSVAHIGPTFFGALTQGAKFSGTTFQQDKQQFNQLEKGAKKESEKTVETDELDFFGYNEVKKLQEKTLRPCKISVEMVPECAGNDLTIKPRKVKGSKPRRKRKLSEGALEEQRLEDETRLQASQLLAPPKTKAGKRKEKRTRRQSRTESMESEATSTPQQSDGETAASSEEEEEEGELASLFKSNGGNADEKVTVGKPMKKPKKESKEAKGVQMLRRQLGIRVSGVAVPAPITSFADMRLDSSTSAQQMKRLLLQNIERSEYKEPTSVQMQAIPSFLLRRDVLATAPTGSGKTAAFAIPMLANLASGSETSSGIRSIVLAPTRDLAVQIRAEFMRLVVGKKMHITLLSKATAATIVSQMKSKLAVNHDVLVATPLRLVHLIREAKVDLSTVEIVCLDEADRLLELGFVEQVDEIFAACTHAKVQRTMFSATMLEGVEELAQTVLRDPVKVVVGTKNAGASTIDQKLVFVGKEEGKLVAMKQLLHDGFQLPALLFVQNKERANELYHELLYDGVNIGAVHADRTKEQRDDVIRRFRIGEVWVLICTDLMSRGMDFKAVNMVINYDFPQSAISYIHRIGRTGRNGRKGNAITFFTEDDMVYLRTIANVMKISGCEVPDWMLSLKKASVSKRKELLKAPLMRHRINTVSGYDLQKANRLQQMKNSKRSKGGQTNNPSEPKSDEKKQEHLGNRKKKHKKNSRTSKLSKSDK
ncbi:hypothetical protein DD238_001242 [Peronospora effusa]|uniref:RNA helicase n=1 Tax=Peronospora effusa TaxID=542832 RepID=A0A3M6VGR8_9STRA|nr:hypothetical protein DD238_001242 [Peronospora effusa]